MRLVRAPWGRSQGHESSDRAACEFFFPPDLGGKNENFFSEGFVVLMTGRYPDDYTQPNRQQKENDHQAVQFLPDAHVHVHHAS